MDILLIMCVGILIGAKIFPEKLKKLNEKMQVVCTILLIFSMGVMLGGRDDFLGELTSLGLSSFLYFFIPAVGSTIVVYLFTRKWSKNKKKG